MLSSVLDLPAAYRAFGTLIGAHRTRDVFAREHVRAKVGERVLDVGCGTGEMVPYLPGVDYVGFDANDAYVRAARIRHPGLRFECDSAESRAAAAGAFDVVMVSAVLHHLDDGEARRLLAMAHESLRPGGRLVTLDPCRVPGQSPVARWLMDRDRGLHVRSKDGYLGIVREVFPQVVVTLRSDLLRIPYTHVILECAR